MIMGPRRCSLASSSPALLPLFLRLPPQPPPVGPAPPAQPHDRDLWRAR